MIERVRSALGLQNILRIFNISIYTFRQWKVDTFTSCFNSIVNKCNRVYPTQLSKIEVHTMKEKLLNPSFQYWPISSLAFHSLRDGSLPLNLKHLVQIRPTTWSASATASRQKKEKNRRNP